MPVDLHYICPAAENWCQISQTDRYRTGAWTAGVELVRACIGGRIFLHPAQKQPAWHGGTIISVEADSKRHYFTYVTDIDFNVTCPVNWSQERAVVWWNEDRTEIISSREARRLLKMSRS